MRLTKLYFLFCDNYYFCGVAFCGVGAKLEIDIYGIITSVIFLFKRGDDVAYKRQNRVNIRTYSISVNGYFPRD